MFYKNYLSSNMKLKNFKALPFDSDYKYDKSDNVLDFGTCKYEYNFDTTSGALLDGEGVNPTMTIWYYNTQDILTSKVLTAPYSGSVKYCRFVRMYDYAHKFRSYLFAIDSIGRVWLNQLDSSDTTFTAINSRTFGVCPLANVINYKGTQMVAFTYYDEVYVWKPGDTSFTMSEGLPGIISTCVYDNRTFATSRSYRKSIIYSDQFNPLKITIDNISGGFINFDDNLGACQQIFTFNDRLYVVREYGITQVTKGKNKRDFEVNNLIICNSLIYRDTIAFCGDKIIFMCHDGIYEFNGTSTKKIDIAIDKFICKKWQQYAFAEYMDGYYYLSFVAKFDDDKVLPCENNFNSNNNAFIKIDLDTKKYVLMRGVEVRSMCAVKDECNSFLMVTTALETLHNGMGVCTPNFAIGDTNILKVWRSTMSDLGYPDKYKYIKEMKFVSKKDIKLVLYLDDKQITISIKGKSTMQTVKIRQKSKLFGFGFESSSGDNYISNPTFVVGVYE